MPSVLDIEALEKVRLPIEQARGLPNEHYTGPDHFAVERDEVLFRNWSGIGFGKDVPASGQVHPVTFLGMPLLIVRDREGQVRVYQNVCRHRGTVLVDAPCKVPGNLIRCPYHSWAYKLDGALAATPHLGGPGKNSDPAFDKGEFGLVEIASHVWQDVVFVNVSGTAPPFEEYAAAAIERWAEFDQPVHFCGEESAFTIDVGTNWKLAVENYCEAYHLPFVHPALNTYSRLEDHYDIIELGHFAGQGTRVYRQLAGEEGQRFPDFANLSESWETQGEYISLFPNVLLGVHRDHSFAIVLEPDGPARTREHVALYYADAGVSGDEWTALRERNAQLWRTVFEEDVASVEGMQRGRSGLKFDGGKFAPAMDRPTHAFHQWIAGRLLEDVG
ncbi:aromatic ring-hydroxylating oxygenase subunit alpha [Paraurantiacibacter namhicola]|uniref:Anthranilate 1,2-dioxygenase large subunit n=1 Tax=Paraurantiacibacter namhicola TaxID=645517 RepID=A0A1C7D4Q8_9SPHN|nr:aromatic ring-hydroxylating dioxygenase subunit alpha [Paraurantiacibacter namhicola]ANU06448.1 Anthranilate 1,2-dioxygenase large subunit [Paraurantiacibacter namhicola]